MEVGAVIIVQATALPKAELLLLLAALVEAAPQAIQLKQKQLKTAMAKTMLIPLSTTALVHR